jgi:LysM repeat protein
MFGAWNVQADEAIAYTVVEGEDIQTVAGRYDVTVEDIMITNGLETEEITVGTVIYIPPKHARGYYDPDSDTYVVAPGDDLFEISKRFGTTVEAIEQANGLYSSKIKAGAAIQIPN